MEGDWQTLTKSDEQSRGQNHIQSNNTTKLIVTIHSRVDETLDKDRRDILNQEPLPTPEEAFALIRREIHRWGIMNTGPPKPSPTESSGIGGGFVVKGRTERPKFWQEDGKAGLRCTHCGGTRHTKKGCFEIIGYPDWWGDRKKKEERKSTSNVVINTDETPVSQERGTVATVSSTSGMKEKEKEGILNQKP